MITKVEKVIFIAIIVLIGSTAIFWSDAKKWLSEGIPPTKAVGLKHGDEKKKDAANRNTERAQGITILKKWELPAELKEISAISYLDKERFACIQDEEGSIFIYNTADNRIERKIPFGEPGDYEGMTLVNGVAYVVNSSGVIFEIKNFEKGKPAVQQYKTYLSAENDVEGLGWDKKKGRLLVGVKKDNTKDQKSIYAFDLTTKQLAKEPAIKLNLESEIFSGGKKKKKDFQPSSISIHRTTGDIYVLEGVNQRLLILNADGAPQRLVPLTQKEFMQPEGITFSPEGDMFISNEGKAGSGNILKVALN